MNAILIPPSTAFVWLVLLYSLYGLRRNHTDPAYRALCIAFVAIAVGFTLSVGQISAAVDRWTGVPNLSVLGISGGFVTFSAAVQILLLRWAHPPELARRKSSYRILALGLVLVIMVTLYLMARVTARAPHFLLQNMANPYVTAFTVFYMIAMATGLIMILVMCRDFAKLVGRTWLRRGMLLTATGAAIFLGYCAARMASVISTFAGGNRGSWEFLVPLCTCTGVILIVIGLTIPKWGWRLSAARRLLTQRRIYQRLRPLWIALRAAVPDVELPIAKSSLAEKMTLNQNSFLLYRRVIEIRDAQRALRPRYSSEISRQALDAGRQSGLEGQKLHAFEEAVQLRFALQCGPVESGLDTSLKKQPISSVIHGGESLISDTLWLVDVAQAFTSSPSVESIAERAARTGSMGQ